jgi:uncharacterized HAD superfamily protein
VFEKIPPSRIGFDFDGVCADTMGLFLKLAQLHYGINGLTKEDITKYSLEDCLPISPDKIQRLVGDILEGNYAFPLDPIDGAAEVLGRIENCHSPLKVITARPYAGPVPEWLERLLSLKVSSIRVFAVGSPKKKAQTIKENNIQYFVDDQLDVCLELQKSGVTPIVFRQPWNRKPHPFWEVSGWQELCKWIEC